MRLDRGQPEFNVIFGVATAVVCFSVAIPVLWWVLPKHKLWLFSRDVDRYRRIQLAYGQRARPRRVASA
jgi:hypothetical protein